MKKLNSNTTLLTAILLLSPVALIPLSAQASHVEVSIKSDIGLFYQQLSEYGQWLRNPKYGLVWNPGATPPHWRPYSLGDWSYVDASGWMWSSDWSWGWATFHYGRWYHDNEYGWCWVPGTRWAPAWVAWRMGNGYVGWAPLPPEVDVVPGAELSKADRAAINQVPESAWTYVRVENLGRDKLLPYILPAARNATLMELSSDITNYRWNADQVVNVGPDLNRIASVVNPPVVHRTLIDVTFPKGVQATRVAETELAVFRPHLVLANEMPEPVINQLPNRNIDVEQLKKQHETQRQVLISHQNVERTDLERHHNELKKRPPVGATAQKLEAWIAQEQQNLRRHHEVESELLRKRQQREGSAAAR